MILDSNLGDPSVANGANMGGRGTEGELAPAGENNLRAREREKTRGPIFYRGAAGGARGVDVEE